jgi:maleylpyruvate isomerase
MAADLSTRIDGVNTSTQALEHSIAALTDNQAREPSLLPGWTRGHVLAHIARNADAMINLVRWAKTGVPHPMYPSREERNAVIEAQSGRPIAELRADVHDSAERFRVALGEMEGADWETELVFGAHERHVTAAAIPFLRRSEVEIHHIDLDVDYTLAHWPEDFVEALLDDIADESTTSGNLAGCVLVANDDEGRWVIAGGGPEISGPPPALLGWMIGRSNGIGLHSESGTLPTHGAWR